MSPAVTTRSGAGAPAQCHDEEQQAGDRQEQRDDDSEQQRTPLGTPEGNAPSELGGTSPSESAPPANPSVGQVHQMTEMEAEKLSQVLRLAGMKKTLQTTSKIKLSEAKELIAALREISAATLELLKQNPGIYVRRQSVKLWLSVYHSIHSGKGEKSEKDQASLNTDDGWKKFAERGAIPEFYDPGRDSMKFKPFLQRKFVRLLEEYGKSTGTSIPKGKEAWVDFASFCREDLQREIRHEYKWGNLRERKQYANLVRTLKTSEQYQKMWRIITQKLSRGCSGGANMPDFMAKAQELSCNDKSRCHMAALDESDSDSESHDGYPTYYDFSPGRGDSPPPSTPQQEANHFESSPASSGPSHSSPISSTQPEDEDEDEEQDESLMVQEDYGAPALPNENRRKGKRPATCLICHKTHTTHNCSACGGHLHNLCAWRYPDYMDDSSRFLCSRCAGPGCVNGDEEHYPATPARPKGSKRAASHQLSGARSRRKVGPAPQFQGSRQQFLDSSLQVQGRISRPSTGSGAGRSSIASPLPADVPLISKEDRLLQLQNHFQKLRRERRRQRQGNSIVLDFMEAFAVLNSCGFNPFSSKQ